MLGCAPSLARLERGRPISGSILCSVPRPVGVRYSWQGCRWRAAGAVGAAGVCSVPDCFRLWPATSHVCSVQALWWAPYAGSALSLHSASSVD